MADRQEYKRPCLDSSVFLGHLNHEICIPYAEKKSDTPGYLKRTEVFIDLWERAKQGKFDVFISAITLAEVYKTKRRTEKHLKGKASVEVVDEFLELVEQDFVEVIEISRRTGLLANQLCRTLNVTPNDGIQLACALEGDCDVFLAWDIPLIGKTHADIIIEEPTNHGADLFYSGTVKASEKEVKEYEKRVGIKKKIEVKPVEFPRGDGADDKGKTAKGNGSKATTENKEEPTTEEASKVKGSDPS